MKHTQYRIRNDIELVHNSIWVLFCFEYVCVCDIFEMIYLFTVFSNSFTDLGYEGSTLRSSSSDSRSYKTHHTRSIKNH